MITVAQDWMFGSLPWNGGATGSGVLSVDSNGVLTTTAGVGDQSIMDFFLPIAPGMILEGTVWGRLISGTPEAFINLYANDLTFEQVDSRALTQESWEQITLRYMVPYNESAHQLIRFGMGVATGDAGDARWHSPVVRVSDGIGSPLSIAQGLIELASGVVSLASTQAQHGVDSVAFNGTNTVTVTLARQLSSGPAIRPTILVSGAGGGVLVPVMGSITLPGGTGVLPSFTVQWTNGTAIQNVSTGTHSAFFQVQQ